MGRWAGWMLCRRCAIGSLAAVRGYDMLCLREQSRNLQRPMLTLTPRDSPGAHDVRQ